MIKKTIKKSKYLPRILINKKSTTSHKPILHQFSLYKTVLKRAITIASCLSVIYLQPASAACSITPDNRYEFIESITLNGSSLLSGNTLKEGDVLQLTPGYSNYAYKNNWTVWLDLNNDGDFSDTNEKVFTTSKATNLTVSALLAIPSTAVAKNTDMRVAFHADNVSNDSCDFSIFGDNDDFTVNVGDSDNGTGGSGNYDLVQTPRGGSNEHILSVAFNSDDYQTGNDSGYADFTDKIFTISDGDNITLTPTSSWGTEWAVWIDSDNNGTFDNDEKVFTGTGRRDDVVTGTIELSNISLGTARMRIAMNGDGSAQPDGFKYGEIEDYTAKVQSDTDPTMPEEPVEPTEPSEKEYGPSVQWEHDSVHVKVFRFEFDDVTLDYSTNRIDSEFKEVSDYFNEQSYGRFSVSHSIYNQVIQVNMDKSAFDGGSSWDWVNFYKAKLIDLGEDLTNMKDDTIYMILAPQINGWDEDEQEWIPWGPKGGPDPGAFRMYADGKSGSNGGGIAHEMGHAMGLHHAEALDGGDNVFGIGNLDVEKIGYGNFFSMMGLNAWDFGGLNLYYKNFFKAMDITSEVPLVTQSGTYRIYALDHGAIKGNLGVRLKAGNNESTYWVEYRTKDGANSDGVQINIAEYVSDNDTRSHYYDTSYLLDMTPQSILEWEGDDWNGYDLKDAELVIGKSYTDKWGNFTITTKRKGGTSGTADAWIEVEVEMH